MGVIADIRDAVNAHVDRVSELHRLRFVTQDRAEVTTFGLRNFRSEDLDFTCICDFAGDRSSWNDHIAEMYRIAAFDAPLTTSVRMSEQAAIEKHRGRITRAAR